MHHHNNIPINHGVATNNTNLGYLLLQTKDKDVTIVSALSDNQLGFSSNPNKRKLVPNSDIPTTSIENDSGTDGAQALRVFQPDVEASRLSTSRKSSLRPSQSKEPRDPNAKVSVSSTSGRLSLKLSKSKEPNATVDRPSTPSTANSSKPQIVIPSSAKRTKQILKFPISGPEKHMGLSEKSFPIASERKLKSLKRAYPKREKVDRSIISFYTSAETAPENPQPDAIAFLRANLDERLRAIDGPAVTFNIEDERLAMLSTTFGFVNDYILLDGVTRVPEGFHYGCNCSGSGPCDLTTCDCLFEEVDSNQKISTYWDPLDNGKLVLHPSFLARRSKIAECCSLCSCKGLEGGCKNTVVQHGRQVRFEIFDTGPRGCGLRSPDPIIAGQFIDRYLGEVLTQADADAREAVNQMGQSYLFILDWKQEEQDEDEDQDEEPDQKFYVVDGQKFGSPTRFINHSCNPNCKIVPVSTTEPGDDNLYHLAFFALCDIPPGTELTFDYNPFWDDTDKAKADPDAVTCLCGEDNCRGQLWPNARKQGPGVKTSPNAKATAKKRLGKNWKSK
ncbi:histone H3 methyltransferase SUV39H1/Clr4 [Penicillium sp. IBT 16267x]|nr:histone H3 methyltransferase SUV39H1/Clr4 [Penicillium sp. IBT 16267x]